MAMDIPHDAICIEREFVEARDAVAYAAVFAEMPFVDCVERTLNHVVVTFTPSMSEEQVANVMRGCESTGER